MLLAAAQILAKRSWWSGDEVRWRGVETLRLGEEKRHQIGGGTMQRQGFCRFVLRKKKDR